MSVFSRAEQKSEKDRVISALDNFRLFLLRHVDSERAESVTELADQQLANYEAACDAADGLDVDTILPGLSF